MTNLMKTEACCSASKAMRGNNHCRDRDSYLVHEKKPVWAGAGPYITPTENAGFWEKLKRDERPSLGFWVWTVKPHATTGLAITRSKQGFCYWSQGTPWMGNGH